eukprot:scaffold33222_cov129-Isochrysis_galbana.AAC.10
MANPISVGRCGSMKPTQPPNNEAPVASAPAQDTQGKPNHNRPEKGCGYWVGLRHVHGAPTPCVGTRTQLGVLQDSV